MDSPSFSSLPKDLVTEIIGRVAVSSHTDLYNAKLCCKKFLEAAEEDCVLQNVSLEGFPAVPWQMKEQAWQFLDKCIEKRNPEALFRKGVVDYFGGNDPNSAIECLDQASRSGHESASYALAIVSIFEGGESMQKGIKLLSEMIQKKMIKQCRQRVKDIIDKIWIKNGAVLDHSRASCCTVHDRRRNGWDVDITDCNNTVCDSCACDQEIESVLQVFHHC